MDFIHVTEVTDTEQLACDFGQTGTQRHVVTLVGAGNHISAVETFGDHDGRHGVGVPLGLRRAQLHAPTLSYRSASTFGEVMMTSDDVIETFFFDHLQ